MNIGLLDIDNTGYPNLALMKISAYHKSIGDNVEWANPLFGDYDILYKSKVFTFSPDEKYIYKAKQIIKGGTGYDIHSTLPAHIDRMKPDYSIYNIVGTSYGFLTRGCPNKCPWCIVPKKEGRLKKYNSIEQIAGKNKKVILMDNNILASKYGISQLQKIHDSGLQVDFNQGLDARLVTDSIAKLLSGIKWLRYIRFGCDTQKQIQHCLTATKLIDKYGYKGEYFFYCILNGDINECYKRISFWRNQGKRYKVFAQPYRSITENNTIPQWQQDMARYANSRQVFAKCDFKEYRPRKGFICSEYFS